MNKPLTPVWQPPENYQPVESKIAGIQVFAPTPPPTKPDAPQTFTCPNCGAGTRYNIAAGGIACEYCGYTTAVVAPVVGKKADEFEFTLETLSQAEQGWGGQRQVLHCDQCGADLSVPQGEISTTCPYCLSNKVNLVKTADEKLRPRFLVPFKIKTNQTRQLTAEWLGKGWFHPAELSANAILQRFNAIYLPYWTFDARIKAAWRAEVGYERTVRHYNAHEKRWETRTEIDWRWENGLVPLMIDDLLVSGVAAQRVNVNVLNGLLPFNTQALVAYKPDFLAGMRAQAYEVTLPQAWETGKAIMREHARDACRKSIASSHVRNLSVSADFSDESWRYILLPVYLAAYRHEERVFQVMINAQTGKVAGQKPVAWWKVWLAIAAFIAPGVILGIIGLVLLVLGVGAPIMCVAIVLLIGGIIGSVFLHRHASEAEAGK